MYEITTIQLDIIYAIRVVQQYNYNPTKLDGVGLKLLFSHPTGRKN